MGCFAQTCVWRLPHRDGVFGARVDDGLQQVVKFCDVQLSLHQELLVLLLHRHSDGCRDLFLQRERTLDKSKPVLRDRDEDRRLSL